MYALFIQTKFGEGYYYSEDSRGVYVTNDVNRAQPFLTKDMAYNRKCLIDRREDVIEYEIVEL